jgi:hypothetical protein
LSISTFQKVDALVAIDCGPLPLNITVPVPPLKVPATQLPPTESVALPPLSVPDVRVTSPEIVMAPLGVVDPEDLFTVSAPMGTLALMVCAVVPLSVRVTSKDPPVMETFPEALTPVPLTAPADVKFAQDKVNVLVLRLAPVLTVRFPTAVLAAS